MVLLIGFYASNKIARAFDFYIPYDTDYILNNSQPAEGCQPGACQMLQFSGCSCGEGGYSPVVTSIGQNILPIGDGEHPIEELYLDIGLWNSNPIQVGRVKLRYTWTHDLLEGIVEYQDNYSQWVEVYRSEPMGGICCTAKFKIYKSGGQLYYELLNACGDEVNEVFYIDSEPPIITDIQFFDWTQVWFLTLGGYYERRVNVEILYPNNNVNYFSYNLTPAVKVKLYSIPVIRLYDRATILYRFIDSQNNVYDFKQVFLLPTEPFSSLIKELYLTYTPLPFDNYTLQVFYAPYGGYETSEDIIAAAQEMGGVSNVIEFGIAGYISEVSGEYILPGGAYTPAPTPEIEIPSITDICGQPPGGFLDYPIENITYSLCKAFSFLFIPNNQQLEKIITAIDEIKNTVYNKPPFGYFILIKEQLKAIEPEATSTELITDFDFLGLNSLLKGGVEVLFWAGFAFYAIKRFKFV